MHLEQEDEDDASLNGADADGARGSGETCFDIVYSPMYRVV